MRPGAQGPGVPARRPVQGALAGGLPCPGPVGVLCESLTPTPARTALGGACEDSGDPGRRPGVGGVETRGQAGGPQQFPVPRAGLWAAGDGSSGVSRAAGPRPGEASGLERAAQPHSVRETRGPRLSLCPVSSWRCDWWAGGRTGTGPVGSATPWADPASIAGHRGEHLRSGLGRRQARDLLRHQRAAGSAVAEDLQGHQVGPRGRPGMGGASLGSSGGRAGGRPHRTLVPGSACCRFDLRTSSRGSRPRRHADADRQTQRR